MEIETFKEGCEQAKTGAMSGVVPFKDIALLLDGKVFSNENLEGIKKRLNVCGNSDLIDRLFKENQVLDREWFIENEQLDHRDNSLNKMGAECSSFIRWVWGENFDQVYILNIVTMTLNGNHIATFYNID